MLVAFVTSKPGSGVSVIATAFALGAAATRTGVRLADLGGDAPALLGLPNDPDTGLHDWMGVGPDAPPTRSTGSPSTPGGRSRCCPLGAGPTQIRNAALR